MKKIAIFPQNSFINSIDYFSEKQTNLFIDIIPQHIDNNEINILFLCEPDIVSRISKQLNKHNNKFNYILTHNKEILDNNTNAILFIFNSIWATNKIYFPKEFTISMVVGNKAFSKNQIMRHKLWHKRNEIPNSKFYVSSQGTPSFAEDDGFLKLPINNKEPMFFSQFHIAIENCSIENFFTEKILDCFISRTVPLYCGCTNIDNFFNTKGILKFNTVDECMNISKTLTSELYDSMKDTIEDNYNRALQYMDWRGRVKIAIEELCK